MKYIYLALFNILALPVLAQTSSLRIQVYGTDRHPLPDASISLNKQMRGTTDQNGEIDLVGLSQGSYSLLVSFLGYRTQEKHISLGKAQLLRIEIQLIADSNALDAVEVKAPDKIEALRQNVFNVTALDARLSHDQSATAGDVMNMTAGVILRENGGLGSQTSFLVNGLSGRQVKSFIDKVPIEYFGSAMSLNVLPVNEIERIGVYKGVVPVDLPGDGLGGTINAERATKQKNAYEADYSFGSFNTHRGLFDIKRINKAKSIVIGASGFINYSDNDYPITVEVPNEMLTPIEQKVRRFHDSYSNYRLESSVNLLKRKWADIFTVSLSYSGVKKEQQHGIQIGVPFGEVESREHHGLILLRQQKQLSSKFYLESFAGFAITRAYFTDTTLRNYNWRGEVTKTVRSVGGETSNSRNLYQNTNTNIFFNALLKYRLGDDRLITINSFNSYMRGRGKDSVASAFYEADIFAIPTTLSKNILSASMEQRILGRLTSITSAKFYNYAYSGFYIARGATKISTSQRRVGGNQAFRYPIGTSVALKGSYEYAARIPDAAELLGFINIIRPNPGLKAEQSHNINAGGQLTLENVELDANFFYRHTRDLIFLQANQFSAQYVNLLTARIRGIEGSAVYRPTKALSIRTDLTYQDIRNRSSPDELNIVSDRYYNARVPNMPYLFGQSTLRYSLATNKQCQWQFWYSAGYVHEFYLNWSIDGKAETKAVIPQQLKQSAGVGLNLNKRFSVIAECKNIFNEKNYNNYNVQLPGRSLNLKIRIVTL